MNNGGFEINIKTDCLDEYLAIVKLANSIIDFGAPASSDNPEQWIQVTERMPKRFKNVLCWYEYRNGTGKMVQTYGIGFYFKDDTWGGEVSNGYDTKVLAWMPLPEPPKEV